MPQILTKDEVEKLDTSGTDIPCEFPDCGRVPTEFTQLAFGEETFCAIYLCFPHLQFAKLHSWAFLRMLINAGLIDPSQIKGY